MSLRESTAELHSKAEKMLFNQKMFKGELSESEYLNYLRQQSVIFTIIETNHKLPHSDLAREKKIFDDIHELEINDRSKTLHLDSTKEYGIYLQSLNDEQILPHVYLNYLALAYGGQMMKSKVPGSGKMYEFDGDVREIAGSIRAIQKDEWVDEANKALDYNINILDELQRLSESTSGETAVDGGEIA
jgi:heme oxygenase